MTETITKYYCDRCGKEMAESAEISWCDTHPNTAIQILSHEWIYADLCDKCKGSFKAWWEKPSESEE